MSTRSCFLGHKKSKIRICVVSAALFRRQHSAFIDLCTSEAEEQFCKQDAFNVVYEDQ